MLDAGQRCSNQAVPGSRFCQTHGKITFTPVKKPADTAPPPTRRTPARPKSAGPSREPTWEATPSSSGQQPRFPGLRADGRNILVAPQGLVWLEAAAEQPPTAQFGRLVRHVGLLSQAFALPGRVRLFRQGESGDSLIFVSPTKEDGEELSVVYDAASSAARLVDGRLYIGEGNNFVQYRDDGAPRGYDVPEYKGRPRKTNVMLVARWGTRMLRLDDFVEQPLADFCLQVRPVPDVPGPPPEEVYALCPPGLYPILTNYFRAHHLRYSLAHLQSTEGELVLFRLRPRPHAPAGEAVPTFILDYLSRLPRVVVLTLAHREGARRILLHWHHRYPAKLGRVAEAFDADDLVLLSADHYPSLRVNPAPEFFDGDQLSDVHVPSPTAVDLTPQRADDMAALKLPVLLRPDNGPVPPISALILSGEELGWLRQVLYRLPGEAFGAYLLCRGQDGAVLLGDARPIEGIPFGLPLRRLGDTELFIPLRSRFVPELDWPILRRALEIKDNVYTLLTSDYRLDLPAASFAPLSRALMAEPGRPRVKFDLRTDASLPELHWTPPPEPPPETGPQAESAQTQGGPLPSVTSDSGRPAPEADPTVHWRQRARAYEEAKDYLSAAVCYSLLDDQGNSARCYRRAAAAISTQQPQRA